MKVRKVILTKALSAVLASAMVVGGGSVSVFASTAAVDGEASAVLAAGVGTQANSEVLDVVGAEVAADHYEAPAAPIVVEGNVITATAHRAASPVLGIMGLNATSGFGMINGAAPTTLEEAQGKAALGIWGTSLNDSPDPYYWNYFYNFHAVANGLEPSTDALVNDNVQASPGQADSTPKEEYGNVSVSLSTRPQIAIGCAARGGADDDTSGYDEQIATIRNLKEGDLGYHEGDAEYNPQLISYQFKTLPDMIGSVKRIADAMDAVTANTGAVGRYGSGQTIAKNYEKYIYGTSSYIMSKIASGQITKKTIAIVKEKNEDGTYTLIDTSSQEATSSNRYAEYTQLVTNNLADSAENMIVDAKTLATADALVLNIAGESFSENANTLMESIKTDLGTEWVNSHLIVNTTPKTLYGLTMNSVENAMGLGYLVGYLYSDTGLIDPVDMCAYFYQNFYHISDLTNLGKVVQVNFSACNLPAGADTSLKDYSKEKIEKMLVEGMKYYEETPDAFEGTYIKNAGWDIDWETGIGSEESAPDQVIQSISVIGSDISKKYGDSAFSLEAVATSGAALTYKSSNENVAAVDANGNVTVKGIGTTEITISAEETDRYLAASVTVKLTVAKGEQIVSTGSDVYNKKATDAAFSLDAKTTGGGQLTYDVTSGSDVVTVDNNAGKVTIKKAGTAKITVTAAETDTYSKGTKTVTVNVAKVSQEISLNKSSVSYTVVKLAGAKQSFSIGASAKTDVKYTVADSAKKYITVTSDGKVTVKKGTPKGTYKITVSAAADDIYNAAADKTVTVTVKKSSQSITLKKASAKYSVSALKKAKKTFSIGAKAKTTVKYTVSASKAKKYIKVTSKGKVTVKKGTPKGTYKITVSAAANSKYAKAASKTVKITVK